MRKPFAITVALALALSLSSCGLKAAVQDKAREMLSGETSETTTENGTGGESAPQNSPSGNVGGVGAKSLGGSGAVASIATLEGYWDGIEQEWKETQEEGYVWTITIDDTERIDMMGLVTVDYSLKLSCSHVGETMFGAYSGEMDMNYNADMDNMAMLFEATGGTVDYDADGWFKNSKFLMRQKPFEQEREDDWVAVWGTLPEADAKVDSDPDDPAADIAQRYVDEYMSAINDMLNSIGSGEQDFEKAGAPVAIWYGYDFRMTEGDMSGYIQMTGIAYGTTTGGGSVDASGTQMQGAARARLDTIFGSFDYSDSYVETVDSPFPYSLKIYEGGQVVFTLYSSNGSPVTVKFYGAIDKIPVDQTTLVRP
jgi:hypothetical protein